MVIAVNFVAAQLLHISVCSRTRRLCRESAQGGLLFLFQSPAHSRKARWRSSTCEDFSNACSWAEQQVAKFAFSCLLSQRIQNSTDQLHSFPGQTSMRCTRLHCARELGFGRFFHCCSARLISVLFPCHLANVTRISVTVHTICKRASTVSVALCLGARELPMQICRSSAKCL